jgi:hypothetical protein
MFHAKISKSPSLFLFSKARTGATPCGVILESAGTSSGINPTRYLSHTYGRRYNVIPPGHDDKEAKRLAATGFRRRRETRSAAQRLAPSKRSSAPPVVTPGNVGDHRHAPLARTPHDCRDDAPGTGWRGGGRIIADDAIHEVRAIAIRELGFDADDTEHRIAIVATFSRLNRHGSYAGRRASDYKDSTAFALLGLIASAAKN